MVWRAVICGSNSLSNVRGGTANSLRSYRTPSSQLRQQSSAAKYSSGSRTGQRGYRYVSRTVFLLRLEAAKRIEENRT